jgi:hypothetical protein
MNSHNGFLLPLAICLGAAAFMIGGAFLIQLVTDAPMAVLTRDPAATFEVPPYVGFLSNATMLVWSAAATICLFGAAMTPSAHAFRSWQLSAVRRITHGYFNAG